MMSLSPILMAITLSSTVLHAEERSYPVEWAEFEVILGDPSCNGPHERLVRAKLTMIASFREVGTQGSCSLDIRRGVEVEEKEMPCDDPFGVALASDQMFQPEDKLGLTANLDICQGLWSYRVSLSKAVLSGTVSGIPFDNIPLNQGDSWIQGFQEAADFGRVGVFVQCSAPATGQSLQTFLADFNFDLREAAPADCDAENCTEIPGTPLVRSEDDWVHVGFVVSCPAAESEGAP